MRIFKITAIMIIIALSTIQGAYAQRKLNIGIVGGLDIANLSSSPSSNTSSLVGFTGGGILETFENEHVSFEFGLLYAQKGAEATAGANYEKITIGYVDIPFHLRIGFPNDNFSPHLFFGPEVGIQTGADAELRYTSGSNTINISGDISKNIETLNFSLNFGGGMDIFLNEQSTLLLDLRYSLGITNIAKNSNNSSIKTSDFQIMTGVKFSL